MGIANRNYTVRSGMIFVSNHKGEYVMGKLTEKSTLYAELSKKYKDKMEEDISLNFFNECVDIALNANKREIRFVLFELRCLYGDVDAGLENVNIATKVIKVFAGDNRKAAFIIAVLETALDEK